MSAPLHNLDVSAGVDSLAAVRRIAVNMTALLTSDVLNRAATFAVYAMVARYCGPKAFGQLSLGLMLLYTFQVFASAGLPTLITREIAKIPNQSGRYFANASMIALGTSLISLTALWMLTVISRYPGDTSTIILLLGLAVLPWSLTTISEAVLRAWERMHMIALSGDPRKRGEGWHFFLPALDRAWRPGDLTGVSWMPFGIALVAVLGHISTHALERCYVRIAFLPGNAQPHLAVLGNRRLDCSLGQHQHGAAFLVCR